MSDLHLGEPEGLLYYKDKFNIIDVVVNKIEEIAKLTDGNSSITNLILNGDIVDLSFSRTEEYKENAYFFFNALFKKVKIDKIIFIPGNHDHHIWVDGIEYYYRKQYSDAPKIGMIEDKNKLTTKYFLPENYDGDILLAYPHYIYDDGKTIALFHHGHFVSPSLIKWLTFSNINSIKKFEELLWNKIELIWWKSKIIEPLPELLWEKFNILIHSVSRKSNRGTTFLEDAIPLTNSKLIENIISYLNKIKEFDSTKFANNFHFIFGHTHFGGRILKEDRFCRIKGNFINIWNLGNWLVPYEKWSPDAIILYYEKKLGFSFYKFVAKSKDNQEGDYDRKILLHRSKFIGK